MRLSRSAEPRGSSKQKKKRGSSSKSTNMNRTGPLSPESLVESMVSIDSIQTTSSGSLVSRAQLHGDNHSTERLHSSERSLDINSLLSKSATRRRKSSRKSQNLSDALASKRSDDHRKMNASALSMKSTGTAASSQHFTYDKVTLNKILGSLTLTGERLVFRPQDRRDKDHIFAWQLDALQKHQISAAGTDACLLKLVSQAHPAKAVTMKFPDRTSLENIHANLSNKLQPVRKYRKLKATLLTTQRKLKESNKDIDELQDTNQRLLDSCEAFAKKCKSLTEELEESQRKEIQQYVANDKVVELEQKVITLRPEVEALRNEKTAMAIAHEMDVENCKARIAQLEEELAEERLVLDDSNAATERLLEDREVLDELQLEVHVLAKELLSARRAGKALTQSMEEQERESEYMLWQVRRQRNNALLEVAHVKKERDMLLLQLHQQQVEKADDIVKETEQEEIQASDDREDEEESVVLGLACLTSSTLDEPPQDRTIPKARTASINQLPWAALGGYLAVRSQAPLDDVHLHPSWAFDSVVMPWRGEASFLLAADRPIRDGGGNQKEQKCAMVDTADNSTYANSVAGTMSLALEKTFKDQLEQLSSPSDHCPAGTMATRAISQFSNVFPPEWSRGRTPLMTTLGHDPEYRSASGCDSCAFGGWSSYESLPNAVGIVASSPWDWNRNFLGDPMAIEALRVVPFHQPSPEQLCLPDNTPVGRNGDDFQLRKIQMMSTPPDAMILNQCGSSAVIID